MSLSPCSYFNSKRQQCGEEGIYPAQAGRRMCETHRCKDCPAGVIRKMINGGKACGGCRAMIRGNRPAAVVPRRYWKGRVARPGLTCDWYDSPHFVGERCGAPAVWVTSWHKRGYCAQHRCRDCARDHNCMMVNGETRCTACERRWREHRRTGENTDEDED
jgi:hypothetical protein